MSRTWANECVCARRGGGRGSLAQHIHTYTYIHLHTGCLCASGGEGCGFTLHHLRVGGKCRIVRCMNASCHIYVWVRKLLSSSIKEPPLSYPGKKGVLLSLQKNTYQRIHELIGELSGRCIKELPKSHTKQNGVTIYCCPPKKNQKVYEHISEYVSELLGGCVKEPQFSRQKKLVLLSLSNTNIYVYIYIYGHIGTILTSWGDKWGHWQERKWSRWVVCLKHLHPIARRNQGGRSR